MADVHPATLDVTVAHCPSVWRDYSLSGEYSTAIDKKQLIASLENTMLLCTKHHHLLHEGGYTIEKDHEGRFYFRSSQGKVMPDVHWTHASRDGFESSRYQSL